MNRVLMAIREGSRKSDFRSVKIGDLRRIFPAMSRAEMDSHLIALGRGRLVNLIPLNDGSMLRPGEFEQMLMVDGTPYYCVNERREER